MSEDNGIEGVFGGDVEKVKTPDAPKEKTPAEKAAATKKAKAEASKNTAPAESSKPAYVRIKLAHNKDIPPSGLYLGHNGTGYLLKPGLEADVPEFLLDVLDNAVTKRPITNASGQIEGWEDQPRFMYSIVRKK